MQVEYKITDGRHKDGVYQDKMIAWFNQQGIDTGNVLVDTIRVHKTASGYYRVRWNEAIRAGQGYLTRMDGSLRTVSAHRVVSERPDWDEAND